MSGKQHGKRVLVLGNYRQTVTVVRSLARAGHPVVIGRHGRRAAAELSRYTSEVWIHPDPAETLRFLVALRGFLQSRPDVGYVFPVSEVEIQPLLAQLRDLSSRVVVVLPARPALEVCLDQRRTCELARELGLPLPSTRAVDTAAELEEAVEEIGFPLVVKRPDSIVIAGRKAIICADRDDFERARAALDRERAPLVIQSWVPGHRHNCHFASRDGEIVAFFQQKVLRTDELDGTGLGVEGVSVEPDPALRRYCETLVRRLRYTGAGCVQFLVDERTGTAAFLEWNPRLDATCDLPYRCGFDFPLLALRLAEPTRGGELPAVPASYAAGRRIYWPAGDLEALRRQVRDRHLGGAEVARRLARFATFPWRRQYHLGWSWRDPLPTLFVWWSAARRALRRATLWMPPAFGDRLRGAAP